MRLTGAVAGCAGGNCAKWNVRDLFNVARRDSGGGMLGDWLVGVFGLGIWWCLVLFRKG